MGALAGVIAGALAAGSIFWKASRAVDESREALESKGKPQFTTVKLDRKPAAGFEAVSAPAVFEDAAIFHGHIFICGHAGLSEFDADGNPVARFRPGFELPAAPLVRMNTGVAADAHEQELYIATAGEGLLAYDGHQMRQIRAASVPLRKLTSVLVTSNGRILMGTEKDGVLAYDGKHLEPLHATLSGIPVTALAGSDSDLWIGTVDRGLLHFIAGRLESWKETDGMPDARVTSIEQANDAVYAGTPVGVAEIRNGKVARVVGQGSFAETLLVRGETLYVGTLEDGTVELSLNSKVARPRRKERPALGQTAVKRLFVEGDRMFELREDRLESNGLAVLKRDASLLKNNNITALAQDPDGRLWVGYFDKGLDIVDTKGAAKESRHVEDDNVYCVNRIVHDKERKRTGVATANGFVLFDSTGAERQVLTKSDGLIANHVTDALLEPDGSWTLGTPAGVTFFENGHSSSIFAMQGLVNNHVYALGECGGRMVVGTLGGISLLDHGLIKASFTTANSALRHNWITAVTGYPNAVTNGCFVGTYGAGVMALDKEGRWSAFSDMPAGVEVNPNAMLSTARAAYAGTLGKGLAVYDVGRERWSFITDGLPSLNVTAVGMAGSGVLYIGTDNGLVRVEESALIH